MTDLPLLFLGVGVLLARVGLCFYLSGVSRAKDAASAILRTIADMAVVVLSFWMVGHAVLSGDAGATFGRGGSFGAPAFFYCAILLIATGSSLGGILERTRFLPPVIASAVMAACVMPMIGWLEWSGVFARYGFLDVGGAASLHLTGGLCAAMGAFAAGARSGKYNQDRSTNMIPGHSFPMTAVGAAMIAVGILPQMIGCAMLHGGDPSLAAADGLLATAAGAAAAMVFGYWRYGILDVHLAIVGMLGGLVSSAAGAGIVPTYAAVVIGGIAGILVPLYAVRFDLRHKIDDPGSSFAIHAVGGALGIIGVGFLFEGGIAQRLHQLVIQFVGLLVFSLLLLAIWAGVWLAMKRIFVLRLGEADELDGSDLAEHDVNAYPDFQQTMIKSYHLRET